MGAILVHEFMSLDGVIDAPLWTFEFGFDPKMGEALAAVTGRCGGILLGRTTYQMFEPAWSQRTVEDDPGAPFFNDTMKYVVSGTLSDATWRNSEIIGAYDPDRIRRLKDSVDGDLYVSGSATLRELQSSDLAANASVTVNPSGVFDLNSPTDVITDLTVDGGSVLLGAVGSHISIPIAALARGRATASIRPSSTT